MWSAWQAIMGLDERVNAGIDNPGAGSAAYGLRISTAASSTARGKSFPAVLRPSRAVTGGGSCGPDCGAIAPLRARGLVWIATVVEYQVPTAIGDVAAQPLQPLRAR